MIMLEKTRNTVLDKTFTSCFKKTVISEKEMERVLIDKDDPFVDLDDIEEYSVQTLGADLPFLTENFGD